MPLLNKHALMPFADKWLTLYKYWLTSGTCFGLSALKLMYEWIIVHLYRIIVHLYSHACCPADKSLIVWFKGAIKCVPNTNKAEFFLSNCKANCWKVQKILVAYGKQEMIMLLLFGLTNLWLIKFFQSSPLCQVLTLNPKLCDCTP